VSDKRAREMTVIEKYRQSSKVHDETIMIEDNNINRLETELNRLSLENFALQTQSNQLNEQLAQDKVIIAQFENYLKQLPQQHRAAFFEFFEQVGFPLGYLITKP
jgi:hypothetical protein